MATIPAMTITFDDGTEVRVEPKTRDMVGAEAAGHDFTSGGPVRGMYATAFAALQRMERRGELPEGVTVPASLVEFLDCADLEADDDGELDPKD